MKTKIIFGAAFLALLTVKMSAQTATPKINERQENQQKRIGEGVEDGKLTPKETVKLEKEEKKIQHDKKEAKADGKVTKQERKEIKHEENKTSKDIYRKKHN